MKRLSPWLSIVPLALAGALSFSPGCGQQGEGERCDPLNGDKGADSDCDSGLVCTPTSRLEHGNSAVCCPEDGSSFTTTACIPKTSGGTTTTTTTTTTTGTGGMGGGGGAAGGAGGSGGATSTGGSGGSGSGGSAGAGGANAGGGS